MFSSLGSREPFTPRSHSGHIRRLAPVPLHTIGRWHSGHCCIFIPPEQNGLTPLRVLFWSYRFQMQRIHTASVRATMIEQQALSDVAEEPFPHCSMRHSTRSFPPHTAIAVAVHFTSPHPTWGALERAAQVGGDPLLKSLRQHPKHPQAVRKFPRRT